MVNKAILPPFSYIEENSKKILRFHNKEIQPYEFEYRFIDQTGFENLYVELNAKSVNNNGMEYAFHRVPSLTDFTAANLKVVHPHSFCRCFEESSITSVSFPNLETVEEYGFTNAFNRCTSLAGKLTFKKLHSIGRYAFLGAFSGSKVIGERVNSLNTISFPALVNDAEHKNGYFHPYGLEIAFQNCSALNRVEFPILQQVPEQGLKGTFSGCANMRSADFPYLQVIGKNGMKECFKGCTLLCQKQSTENAGYKFDIGESITDIDKPESDSIGLTIGDGALQSCFEGCTNFYEPVIDGAGNPIARSPDFLDRILTIGDYGMKECFKDCTKFSGVVSFNKLIRIGTQGLYHAFSGTDIDVVRFKKVLAQEVTSTGYNYANILTPSYLGLKEDGIVQFNLFRTLETGIQNFETNIQTCGSNRFIAIDIYFANKYTIIPEVELDQYAFVTREEDSGVMYDGNYTAEVQNVTTEKFTLVIRNSTSRPVQVCYNIEWTASL